LNTYKTNERTTNQTNTNKTKQNKTNFQRFIETFQITIMATSTIQSTIAGIIKTDISDPMVVALIAYIEQQNTASVKKVKAKKEKRETGPKRPASSYIRWLSVNRDAIKDDHFGEAYVLEHGELTGRDKTTAITKKAGELWNQLTDDAKAPWIEAYEKAKVEYIKNNPSKVSASASVAFSFEDNELTECPEGYEGPYNQQYLWGYAIGRKRGVGIFDNLEDAVKAADSLGTKCGGITKQKSGFTLRMGGKLWKDLNNNQQTWVKKDCDADVKLTRKDGKSKKLISKSVAEPAVEIVAEPVVEIVTEPAVEIVAEPVVEIVAEPVVEIVAEPVVEIVAEPVVEIVAEPVVEIVATPKRCSKRTKTIKKKKMNIAK
jgi:hypothetical protein